MTARAKYIAGLIQVLYTKNHLAGIETDPKEIAQLISSYNEEEPVPPTCPTINHIQAIITKIHNEMESFPELAEWKKQLASIAINDNNSLEKLRQDHCALRSWGKYLTIEVAQLKNNS